MPERAWGFNSPLAHQICPHGFVRSSGAHRPAPGDPGAACGRRAAGGAVPPVAGAAARRLRRRRRLLRHLRLPDHLAAASRGRPHRLGEPDPLLGPADAPPAAGVVPGADGLRRRGPAARAAAGLAPVLQRDPRGGAVRRELDAGAELGELPGCAEHALAGPALLDPLGRGAVLPRLAAAGAARALARGAVVAPQAADLVRGAGGGDRGKPRLLAVDHRPRPGLGLLRHHCPRLGVRRRCPAGLRSHRVGARRASERGRVGGTGRLAGLLAGLRRQDPDARHGRDPRRRRLGGRDLGGRPGTALVALAAAHAAACGVARRHLLLDLPVALAADHPAPGGHRASAHPGRPRLDPDGHHRPVGTDQEVGRGPGAGGPTPGTGALGRDVRLRRHGRGPADRRLRGAPCGRGPRCRARRRGGPADRAPRAAVLRRGRDDPSGEGLSERRPGRRDGADP